MNTSNEERERLKRLEIARRALRCLHLEAPESVVNDVTAKIEAVFADLEAQAARVAEIEAECDEAKRWIDYAETLAARIKALEEGLREIAVAPRVPEAFTFTGTDARSLENLFDAELRHRSGMKPVDYLKRWLPMFRPFAFATKDDSWGELEKLICITLRNYVTTLEKCRRASALLHQGEEEHG